MKNKVKLGFLPNKPKKSPKVAPFPEPNYASIARNLMDSFLLKGFATDQAFELVMLVMSKSLHEA